VLKPSIGRDYAPTGIWDSYFGRVIPTAGDPELARALIAASGETPGKLIFRAPDTPTQQRVGRAVVDSLARAGIQVEFQPIEPSHCYGICPPDWTGDFGSLGWGHDFPSASTVIQPLFTRTTLSSQRFDGSSFPDLSEVDDPSVDAAVDDALSTLDRRQQASKWQALNRQAVESGWVIPTFFGQSQTIAGTKVGPIYRWPAYASWPYAEMAVWE
jgi:ABC-type transport system substrate-binding protein